MPVTRQLAGAEIHRYGLAVEAGEVLKVIADQKGIDIVLELVDADGRHLVEADYAAGRQGTETLSVTADNERRLFRVVVRAASADAPGGQYSVRISERRTATVNDPDGVRAQHTMLVAEQLRRRATSESRREAVKKFQEARDLYRAAGDRAGEANALNDLGATYFGLSEYATALELYRESLAISRAIADAKGEAQALLNIGVAQMTVGEYAQAIDHLDRALALRRSLNDRTGEVSALRNLAVAFSFRGEYETALQFYHSALAVGDSLGVPPNMDTLNNIASVYTVLGDHRLAFEYLNRSLALARAGGDQAGEGRTLYNIGRNYYLLGEYERALAYSQDALRLRRATGNRRDAAITLNSLGVIQYALGNPREALQLNQEAYETARAVGDRRLESGALNQIGVAHFGLGDPSRAIEHYQRALAVAGAIGDRAVAAQVLTDLGRAYAETRAAGQAVEMLNEALPLRRAVKDRRGEALTLHTLARVERDRGELDAARRASEAVLAIVETIRGEVLSPDLRVSYLAAVRDFYELNIDILARLHQSAPTDGYAARALEVSEKARARGLLDSLAESAADIREGIDQQLLDRERSLRQALNARAARHAQLSSTQATEAQAAELAKEIDTLTNDSQDLQARIRAESPRYAALMQPQPLTAREIQDSLLDAETVLLEYALGEERSYLWAVSRDALASYELPGRATIDGAVRRLYDAIKSGPDEQASRAAAADLSAIVLAPIAEQFRARRLVIVADGALHYTPFAALAWPAAPGATARPLATDHEIVSLPSASALAVMRREVADRPLAPRTVAVLADPVFSADDIRLAARATTSQPSARLAADRRADPATRDVERIAQDLRLGDGTGFGRLIGTRREARGILTLVPGTARKQALDFDASRATATSGELAQYRIVHFATHGVLNSVHPALSGIVLSLVDRRGQPQDGFLRLHDIYNLKLPVELVVLSACQTALGREIRGEGLIGLTRGFMYAGARRIVATLWKVDDRATAELMKHFYTAMLGPERLRPAAALRAAQIALAQQKRWQAPYYWAAFVLQGEWR